VASKHAQAREDPDGGLSCLVINPNAVVKARRLLEHEGQGVPHARRLCEVASRRAEGSRSGLAWRALVLARLRVALNQA
jgi:hypothetical protein